MNAKDSSRRITLAITGASGACYGLRLLECLLGAGCQVSLLVSRAAHLVIATETGEVWPEPVEELAASLQQRFEVAATQLQVYALDDWFSAPASGSAAPASMVVCPCSGGTLAAIATGASNNLIERAADVALKERRKLILVTRETPLHEVHLQHQLTLTRMGAVILPASPGFYHQPATIADLVDFVVARVLDQLGLDQALVPRWGTSTANSG